jgi:selenocysteine lyase/cysteine desulfurase
MPSRRDFFRAAAALPASWMAFGSALRAAGSDESYWQMVQRQFPLDDGLIYLNAANVCPASRLVMDRHLAFLRDFHGNPSFQNRDKYTALRESLRSKVARMLRVTADEVAVTRNTSEGSNLVVKGVDLKAGDEVMLTRHNHPSNLDSWKVRARRDGFSVKELAVPVPARSAEELYSASKRKSRPARK